MEFTNKTIWITGASSGIGKAVALELSHKKVHLILSARNQKELEKVAEACTKNGSTTQVVAFDLADEKSIENATAQIIEKGKPIHSLYHFGGVSQRSIASETPISIDRTLFEINFFGTVLLTKKVLPIMIHNGGGHIAVTTSIVGKFGFPYRTAYSATKHALQGFFESLRAETKHQNIKVSIIIPGRIQTNISMHALTKDGTIHQEVDKGQAEGMAVEKAAKKIVKQLGKNKKEILVGNKELLMVSIRRYIPKLYYYLSSRIEKV